MNIRHVYSLAFYFAFLFPLAMNAGCEKRVSKPSIPGKNSGAISGNTQGGANVERAKTPFEIQIVNTKFAGEESKLEAQVVLAGVTSARVKLVSAANIATISVPGLPVNAKDTMRIELYEGTSIRYVAYAPDTLIEQGKRSSLKLEDCSLNKAPWDGESNLGTCGWSVKESK